MTVLEVDYFEEILKTYQVYPDALGVEDILTMRQNGNLLETAIMFSEEYCFDGWKRKEGSLSVLSKKIRAGQRLSSRLFFLYSHGRSVGFYS
jgi:hypothetical protein